MDLDNTLLDFFKSEKESIKSVFLELNLDSGDCALQLYSDINDSFWKRFERGEIKICDIQIGRFIEFLKQTNQTADPVLINDRYFYYLSQSVFKLPGYDEVVPYLVEKGYKIYIITNGAASNQHSRIKISGLDNVISGLFISEEMGAQKPEKAFFDIVFENITEKDKSKMLVIGDSVTSDILGGVNAGLDTCLISEKLIPENIKPTYKINNLLELKNIL
jgi:2-haloacid dehalogenase